MICSEHAAMIPRMIGAETHLATRRRAYRDRLANIVLFFAQRAQHVGKIKLFKLIYLLDFEHFRQTGRSVTGLDYYAWKFGPVPTDLMEEWEAGLGADLSARVTIQPEQVIDYTRYSVTPNDGAEFDDSQFTPRQLGIMEALVEQYGATYSPTMIDVTHAQNGAWDKVWRDGHGKNESIPYTLALSDAQENREAVLNAADDALNLSRAFG